MTQADLSDPAHTSLPKAERLRAWTAAYERERGYQRCGAVDPTCLQFHHGSDTKTAAIGRMIPDSYPVADVLTEVEHCRVLCANCPRIEHYEPPTDTRDRATRPDQQVPSSSWALP